MNKLLSPEKFAALLQAIDSEPTGKLSELARVARLNLAEDYIGADLSGEDLSEDDLRGINLSGADLSGANLSRSNLSGAILRGAVLKDADLTNADLTGTDLTHADLTNTILIGTLLDTKPLNPREQLPTAGLENGAFPTVEALWYVERPPIEAQCYRELLQEGALVRLKAPQKMGKTLLIGQIFERLQSKGYRTARVSLKGLDREDIAHLERLLRCFCQEVSRELNLPSQVKEYWQEERGNKSKCTSYFEDYLLPDQKSPLVLAIDDLDWLFLHPTVCEDFCLMLRNWHEKAKTRQIWQRLRLLVAHATEEYIKLPDHHSPFNVGVPIELPEFTSEQVQALAKHCGLKGNSIEISQLMDLVGGHPYLVNLAFSHLKAHPDVTLPQLLTLAPTEQGIYSSHLRELLDVLRQNPDLRVAFKVVATASEPVCLETLIGHKLRSMGLIKWHKNQALPSCQLYRRYFSDRL